MFLAESEISPQVIIVFVAMIYAGLKALLDKRKAAQEGTSDIIAPDAYEADLDYEELIEEQRAELGLPPLRQVAKPPPPLPVAPPVAIVPTPAAEPPIRMAPTAVSQKTALGKAKSPISEMDLQKTSGISTKGRLKQHLSSPTAAREALLLSEILGPPKALK